MHDMKTYRSILFLCMVAALGMANEQAFSRYQLIVDRQPFGQEPPDMAGEQASSSASFARDLRLSMLFEGTDGTTRAGIIDNSTGKSYILRINEPQNGLEMMEADVTKSEAMIRKGQEVALFKLHSADGEPVSNSEPDESRESKTASSYSERRRMQMQRLEERARRSSQPPPQPTLTGEALKKHLEQVQMDAIRNGLPPLPMQLTPEMDAQLVAEGVLPPP